MGVWEVKSPSRVFRNDIGRMLPLGLAQGIEDGMGSVNIAMSKLNGAISTQANGINSNSGANSTTNYNSYGTEQVVLVTQLDGKTISKQIVPLISQGLFTQSTGRKAAVGV